MSTTLTVRTEEETIQKLDHIAEAQDRNRNSLINEAINQYLEMHAWRLEQVQKGIADTDAGRSISMEELKQQVTRWAKR